MATSSEVRSTLVDALSLDLVGPGPNHPLANEQLTEADRPTRWYLCGFLVPASAPESTRYDPESEETLDGSAEAEDGDDSNEPDKPPAKKVFLPSSMGLSVLVPPDATELEAEVFWGEYKRISPEEEGKRNYWQRSPKQTKLTLALPSRGTITTEVPQSRGVKLFVSTREVKPLFHDENLPAGTKAVSVFLVNERDPEKESVVEEAVLFQVELTLRLPVGFVPRPNIKGLSTLDPDERIADLQYRDVFEYVVGHGVSTCAVKAPDGSCREVRSSWLPVASVEKVDPTHIPGIELSMEALASLSSHADAQAKLGAFATAYDAWIEAQRAKVPTNHKRRLEVSQDLLQRCTAARHRIAKGVEALSDPKILEAFKLCNRAMSRSGRQRNAQILGKTPSEVPSPKWRPFQLAFLLMSIPGLADPTHVDREVLDLLFFPTGGGKTEAYLGLAAFTIVLRRLRDPNITGAGLTVMMRYTLRLLTLDQLSRAAALVCALELERQEDPAKLGKWPFEVGLWVGRKATPNRMGKKGDNDPGSARARTIAFKGDSKGKPSPIPLENCPWCGAKFSSSSFELKPNVDAPLDLRIVCSNDKCDFTRDQALPILAVDEPIYRRLPCFLIATVDKLAALPWLAAPGKLFGKVTRYDNNGFYGYGDPQNIGQKLAKQLQPPSLIIQDELHLISGPLGTMVGLYETVVEKLCSREVNDKKIKPKIVASTATVRRAESQVRALFAREQVEVFPPPGPDREDSFFARTVPESEKPARLYLGIAAPGRSLKVVLLRSYLALLTAAKKQYEALQSAVGDNPADPYMTLLGYFSSLRELGGSRRIVEDEVRGRAMNYSRRRRLNEPVGRFSDRTIQFDAMELTSRVATNEVAEAKRRLSLLFKEDKRVDVALATNMISVGLDISRLGLMVVLGQPKTTAEYIQATSRVGRDEARPGLVVTLLNVHKPRDRSHFERFESYHESFYRSVEATSVTPFAPRAIDRGLPAVLVALSRHEEPSLTPAPRAADIATHRAKLGWVAKEIKDRADVVAANLDPADRAMLLAKLDARCGNLFDAWEEIASLNAKVQAGLQYSPQEAKPRTPLLHTPLDAELRKKAHNAPEQKFKAQWSMRDVEAEVPLWVKRLDGGEP